MLNVDKVEIILSHSSSVDVEVLRNVKMILTTIEETVPYYREFGISGEIIDLPINEAQGLYMVECISKIRKYEPRAIVESVDFSHDVKGVLYPKVVLSIEPD